MQRGSAAPSLWRHGDFLKLWTGETVSLFGGQVSTLALPLTAVLALHASAADTALLTTVGSLPNLLFGLLAGVLADRTRRRPILLWTNLGRALLLLGIPLAALAGVLSLPLLYATSFLIATLGVLFGAAYAGLLPSLVEPGQLVDANSKLGISRSLASITGPGIAGTLVQLLSAPLVLIADAVSYLMSAATILLIRAPECPPEPAGEKSVLQDLREGIVFVLKQPVVRDVMLAVGAANFFLGGLVAEFILFLTRGLHLDPRTVGWVLATMGVSTLLSTLLAGRVSRLVGAGPAMIGGGVLYGLGALCVPLAGGSMRQAVATLIAGQIIMGLGSPNYYINFSSLVQAVTPRHFLGRVNTITSLVISGTVPFGSLVGGGLSEIIGVRLTLVGVGIGVTAVFASLLGSCVATYRRLDTVPP
jgi:MFS family permease